LTSAGIWRLLLAEAAQKSIVASFESCGGVPRDIVTRMVDREGSAGAVLREYADRDDDVLVLGPSWRRGWWPFGGRVVRACTQNPTCMVVVVPPAALARKQPVSKLLRELRRDMRRFERSGS
jgi:nucleotide-binding universal stress UspA family protein